MENARKISRIFNSKPVLEGAGVTLKRAFGFSQLPLFDPFLLLDDFRSSDPQEYLKGFPWHPHRGIETITYVLDGYVEHADSMGNRGIIAAGEVQWMSAGSGIIHEEMPFGNKDGRIEGFQLWANLPGSQKMTPPCYRSIAAAQIPFLQLENGVAIRIVSGRIGAVEGPASGIAIDPEYLDVTLPPDTTWTHPINAGRKAFAYVIAGKGIFNPENDTEDLHCLKIKSAPFIENDTLLLFSDGERITVATKKEPVRFLLVSGNPLNEPVAWNGPIVMNSREELQKAFEEFRNGTFVKKTN
ncbi:MAG: pirin family protein [Chlorobium sp.]|uniref:pirin family protein n=1 Tax=Chlorobium sp. TaxID=1095 RepID=UPI0025BFF394|nr:pirin family protein [Chlorobium sp.]MCF8215323.1 pirin family protein [Chlorobium sp.]MCF8270160.1 pirin family protein [Chlorobium sp.]MCF8286530.1 pirin family protein [Chlorobium sp.]MCF8290128.1 pirin family protein [Chlorobium sp.]MCF8384200.1 pirin family protein [Chlorobium sp.]